MRLVILKNKPSSDDHDKAEKTKWSTPKDQITMISVEKVTDAVTTMQEIKQNIVSKNITSGFKNIRYLNNGAYIVESHNKEQQEKLKSALKDKKDIKIKETQNIPQCL